MITDDEDEDKQNNLRDCRKSAGVGKVDTEAEAPAKRRRTESSAQNESTRNDESVENIENLIAQASALSESKGWLEVFSCEVNLCAQGGIEVTVEADSR